MWHTDAGYVGGQPVAPGWRRRLIVRLLQPGELPRWRRLMADQHYLGDGRLVGPGARYVAELDGQWVALLAWAAAAWRCRPRDRWLGWAPPLRDRRLRYIANNVRFVLLAGVRVPNLASAILAANTRRLAADWRQLHGWPVLLAETFVDPRHFAGICYRAAGWLPLGRTRGFGRRHRGYVVHGVPKEMWVRPLCPQARRWLTSPWAWPQLEGGQGMTWAALESLNWCGPGGLRERLAQQICDPRHRRGIRHSVVSVLLFAAGAVLAGARSFQAIAEWAEQTPQDLRARFGARRHGTDYQVPSEPTIRRVLQSIDPHQVDAVLADWLAAQQPGAAVAVDGKTLRGSGHDGPAVHLLSAVLHGSGTVLAQRAVPDKTNEIPELPRLLQEVDLQGKVVTADALHTQASTVSFLVEEKGADYLLQVKANQPGLLQDIQALDPSDFSPSVQDRRNRPRPDRTAGDPHHDQTE